MTKEITAANGTQKPANIPTGKGAVVKQGVRATVQDLWDKMSQSLVNDPELHWENALSNASDLARSVCGKDLPADLEADLIGNIALLEKTLIDLKITSSETDKKLLSCKLNIVADSKHLKELEEMAAKSAN